MMSRTKTVKVHSFSGSTVQDTEYSVEPLLARYPDHIIIHIGTNNLSDESMTADRIADDIFQLANKIEERGIKCTISELITRRDEYNEKAKLVNKKLEERKSKTNIGLVKHDNIVSNHLNYGGSTSTEGEMELLPLISLAHKSYFPGHVIVPTGPRRMHFPHPGIFLRSISNLQQVDFSQGFASNNILGIAVLAVNDGFLHLHV